MNNKAKAGQAKPQQVDIDEAALIAAVDADQRARRAIPADQLERFYREKNAREDVDPEIKANREAGGQAGKEIARALAEGDSWAEALERGKQACGRDDLNFDDRQRVGEIRRETFRRVFPLQRRLRGALGPQAEHRSQVGEFGIATLVLVDAVERPVGRQRRR